MDDLTITVRGSNASCRDAVWRALDQVKEGFLDLGWQLSLNKASSKGKTVAIATNAALEAALSPPAATRGVRVGKHARGLGPGPEARPRPDQAQARPKPAQPRLGQGLEPGASSAQVLKR